MKMISMVFEDEDFDELLQIAKSQNIIPSKMTLDKMDKDNFLKFVSTIRTNDHFDIEVRKE